MVFIPENSAGADITEFGGKAVEGPNLRDVIAEIEACSKPVVAAINGLALGGGLEVYFFIYLFIYSEERKKRREKE